MRYCFFYTKRKKILLVSHIKLENKKRLNDQFYGFSYINFINFKIIVIILL